ncbi:MAG TPA: T9SS type A sorting domain-containing protein [Bacteroidales bacterium]|nr:T9SS type A sorting domain-containing protein [Bacteroidales bacterium]HRZ48348.1 T9SS type A sorting domain-containing protein [Bacteroidales bacterium]
MRNLNTLFLRLTLLVAVATGMQTTVFGQSQLPNSNFEQWTGNKPTSWDGTNFQVSIFIIQTVFKDSVAPKSGIYNPLLETKLFNLLVATPTIPGILTLGTVVMNTTTYTGSVEGGIPFTGMPSALSGFIKTEPAAGDSGMVALGFSKWNGTTRDTIGAGLKWFPDTDTTWQPFSVPIQWSTAQNPDSMNIIISCSAVGNEVAVVGSKMHIDSLTLHYGSIGVELPMDDRQFTVWGDGSHTLHYSLAGEQEPTGLTLFDLSGREIIQSRAASMQGQIDVQALPAGVYVLKLTTAGGKIHTRKFVLR